MGSAIDLVLAGGNSAKISRPSEMQRLSTEFWRQCLEEKKSSSTGSSKKQLLGGSGPKWHKAQTHRMRFLMFAEAMDLELEHGLMEEQHDLMAESSS